MGVTLLRASHPTLIGTGINVAQPEGLATNPPPEFEVNYTTVGEPESLFAWISTNGTSTTFTNALGAESRHADDVAGYFYGPDTGVGHGVAHVDNYEADYFYQFIVTDGAPMNKNDLVVNQSFAFFIGPPDQQTVDSAYDNYIANNGNIFCSAVNGNNGSVGPPGTAYNCIGVAAYGVVIAEGPTLDNQRSKPDIVASGNEISWTTPYVSGAAAVLLQAAAAGDGGSNASDASDARTIKALLLNGALKPFDWTHTTTAPLDTRYGAGVLNLFYSYQQLAGRQQAYTSENTVSSGGAHPPISSGQAIGSLAGWDYESVTINLLEDTVNHYLFNISSNSTLTTTLVWERHAEMSGINNLSLFLYNTADSSLVTSSVSTVDNVQHLYVPHLVPGKYDLQVVTYSANSVGLSETYALAFQFFPMSSPKLSISASANATVITWPWSPTVYTLQETSSLSAPVDWTNVTATEWITNDNISTSIDNPSGAAFFRLVR